MITTDDLRFFLSLASTRSLAQAARALDVTPPAVTQRLNALEKRLGVRLVNRSGRGTALTDEAACWRSAPRRSAMKSMTWPTSWRAAAAWWPAICG